MNILLYSHSYLPKIGGREIVVEQLAKALIELGHGVRVVGPGWTRIASRHHGIVPVHRYPRLKRNIAASGRVGQRLGELELLAYLMLDVAIWRCDVIHAHSLYPGGYAAHLLKKLFPRIPLLLTPHGIDINTVPDSNYGMRLDPKLRRKIDLTLAGADAVTAISDGIFDSLRTAGVCAERIYRVGNGIDATRFERRYSCGVRQQFGIPSDGKIILSVGNYSPLKGQANLVNAMPQILASQPRARLVIVGGGTEALRPVIESTGVGDAITLTGSIAPPVAAGGERSPPDMLADLYLESDVYVSASNAEGAEGLSLALLDSMAAGLPVVATDIVGNRDAVQHGSNGCLVDPNDQNSLSNAIINVINNDELRLRMGRQSKRDAKEHTWTNIAKKYVEIYEELREKGAARATKG